MGTPRMNSLDSTSARAYRPEFRIPYWDAGLARAHLPHDSFASHGGTRVSCNVNRPIVHLRLRWLARTMRHLTRNPRKCRREFARDAYRKQCVRFQCAKALSSILVAASMCRPMQAKADGHQQTPEQAPVDASMLFRLAAETCRLHGTRWRV